MFEHPTKKEPLWLLPDAQEAKLRAGLYILATPIGNLRDMSFRALDILAGVDVVLAEDTRVSGKLLKHYGIKAKLEVYNDHSESAKREVIAERISGGQKIALISDAGMPLISDPGYKLVEILREKDLYVTSVPGANAPLAALQLSGLPSDRFSFLGFLPPKSGARQALFREWAGVNTTLLAFEAAPRLQKALGDMEAVWPDRKIAVVREITKMFEEVKLGSASELLSYYNESGAPKGEIVLVIGPPGDAPPDETQVKTMLQEALKTMKTKEAAAFVAEKTGVASKALYAMALEIKAGE